MNYNQIETCRLKILMLGKGTSFCVLLLRDLQLMIDRENQGFMMQWCLFCSKL